MIRDRVLDVYIIGCLAVGVCLSFPFALLSYLKEEAKNARM
jgi:hypothetical protein